MKYTMYHAQYRTLRLIRALDNELDQAPLNKLKVELQKLEQSFFDANSLDLRAAQQYRQLALDLCQQSSALLSKKHRSELKAIALALVCFAQKIELITTPEFITKIQEQCAPLMTVDSQLGITLLRPLSQHSSVYLSGRKGICALAAKEWLADNFMSDVAHDMRGSLLPHEQPIFIEQLAFQKEELFFLYRLEKEQKKTALTFFSVTRLVRLSTGAMLWALLNELASNKKALFLITFAHFKTRMFHAVGCKLSPNLLQWFDSDCGIFQNEDKEQCGAALDWYLTTNQYKEKFSFFSVQMAKRTPHLSDVLVSGVKWLQHL